MSIISKFPKLSVWNKEQIRVDTPSNKEMEEHAYNVFTEKLLNPLDRDKMVRVFNEGLATVFNLLGWLILFSGIDRTTSMLIRQKLSYYIDPGSSKEVNIEFEDEFVSPGAFDIEMMNKIGEHEQRYLEYFDQYVVYLPAPLLEKYAAMRDNPNMPVTKSTLGYILWARYGQEGTVFSA